MKSSLSILLDNEYVELMYFSGIKHHNPNPLMEGTAIVFIEQRKIMHPVTSV
jgi:hypothetical protein